MRRINPGIVSFVASDIASRSCILRLSGAEGIHKEDVSMATRKVRLRIQDMS
jgi:hypothetical protein